MRLGYIIKFRINVESKIIEDIIIEINPIKSAELDFALWKYNQ